MKRPQDIAKLPYECEQRKRKSEKRKERTRASPPPGNWSGTIDPPPKSVQPPDDPQPTSQGRSRSQSAPKASATYSSKHHRATSDQPAPTPKVIAIDNKARSDVQVFMGTIGHRKRVWFEYLGAGEGEARRIGSIFSTYSQNQAALKALAPPTEPELSDNDNVAYGFLMHKVLPFCIERYEEKLLVLDAWTVTALASCLKAIVDTGFVKPTDPHVVDAFNWFMKLIVDGELDSGTPQSISSTFNGLTAWLQCEPPATPQLTQAYIKLMALVAGGRLGSGGEQSISNTFNGLKAGLDASAIDGAAEQTKKAYITLLDLVAAGKLDSGTPFAISITFNGLRAGLDARAIDGEAPQLKKAYIKLVDLVAAGKLDGGLPIDIGHAFNGLKAGLDVKAIDGAAEQTKKTYIKLIDLIVAGKLDSGKPFVIGHAFDGLRAGLNAHVINGAAPGPRKAYIKLIDLVAAGKLDSGSSQSTIAATFNGLKAGLEATAIDGAAVQTKKACIKLIELVAAGRLNSGSPQNIAATFNGLKAGLEATAIDGAAVQTKKACIKLIELVAAGRLNSGSPRNIVVTFNGLKAGLEAKAIDGAAEQTRKAYLKLIDLVAAGKLDSGKPFDIAITFDSLRAGLDAKAIDGAAEQTKKTYIKLIDLVAAGKLDSGKPVDIAHTFNGLKAGLDAKAIDGAAAQTKKTYIKLIDLVAAGKLDSGKPVDIARTFNGLKAGLDAKAIDGAAEQTKKTYIKLIDLVAAGKLDSGKPFDIARTFNGLKAGLDAKAIDGAAEQTKKTYIKLIDLVAAGKLDSGKPIDIAITVNGLKAGLDAKAIHGAAPQVTQAYIKLIDRVAAGKLDSGSPQDIAITFNGLKAGLDAKTIDGAAPQLKEAYIKLIDLVAAGTLKAGRPQGIANTLTGLKAGLDAKPTLIDQETPRLKQAYHMLMGLVASDELTDWQPRAIANCFAGLKAGLDAKAMHDDDPALMPAYGRLIGLVAAGDLDSGEPVDIANTFNGLKAGFDAELPLNDDDQAPLLREAYEALIQLVAAGKLDSGTPQDISNALNGLKAGLDVDVQRPVIDDETPKLVPAFEALMRLIVDGQLEGGAPQAISNSLGGLLAALYAGVFAADHVGLRGAVATLASQAHAKVLSNGSSQHLSQTSSAMARLAADGATEISRGWPLVRDCIERLCKEHPFKAAEVLHSERILVGLARLYGVLLQGPAKSNQPETPGPQPQPGAKVPPAGTGRAEEWNACRVELRKTVVTLLDWADMGKLPEATDNERCQRLALAAVHVERFLTMDKRIKSSSPERKQFRARLEKAVAKFVDKLVAWRQAAAALNRRIAGIRAGVDRKQGLQPTPLPAHVAEERLMTGSMLEFRLIHQYRPDIDLTPAYEKLDAAQQQAIMKAAYDRLKGAPMPMADKPGSVRFAVIDRRGKLLGHEVRDCSIYQELFGQYAKLTSPVMMKLDGGARPDNLPACFLHEEQWHRFDVFGGGRLKPDFMEGAHGSLIGIPLEASDFFDAQSFTSIESFCYGQRAWLPETATFVPIPPEDKPATVASAKPPENKPGATSAKPPGPTRGVKGRITVALIPDGNPDAPAPQLFPPNNPYAQLRTQDGFGFIREGLAKQLGIDLGKAADRSAAGQPARLSYQALQYYPDPATLSQPDAQLRKAIIDQAHELAWPKLQPLLNKWSAETLKQEQSDAWYYTFIHGGPEAYAPTAVPTAGAHLLLPDANDWRKIAKGGLVIGRNPYDTTNLCLVPAGEIDFSSVLAERSAFQYTLNGYAADDKDKGVLGAHFFKGLFMVVPEASWPKAYVNQQVLLSSKDQKMCSDWQTLELKSQAQGNHATLEIHGCLVIKEERKHVVGVPYATLMKGLAGDYDGDRVDVIPQTQVSALAKLIAITPKLDNPKMPKAFNPRKGTRPGNGKKIGELRLQLLQDWVSISALYCAAMPKLRAAIDGALAPTHVLDEVLGEAWHRELELPDPGAAQEKAAQDDDVMEVFVKSLTPEQRSRIMRTEISIGIKAGTDAEKTTVPVAALKQRALAVKRILRVDFQLQSVPYGKGFRNHLKMLYNAANPLDALVTQLEKRIEHAEPPQPTQSVPKMAMTAIVDTFLQGAGAHGHLAGANLKEACQVLGRIPTLLRTSYAAWKYNSIITALVPPGNAPSKVLDGGFRLPDLVPALVGLSGLAGGTVEAQRALEVVAKRIRHPSVKLCDGLSASAIRCALAEIIAAQFEPLASKNATQGLAGVFDVLAAQPACTKELPGLARWKTCDAKAWSRALLDLMDAEGVRSVPDVSGSFIFKVNACSVGLAAQLCLSLARVGDKKGRYKVQVAPHHKRALEALLDPHGQKCAAAGVTITVQTWAPVASE